MYKDIKLGDKVRLVSESTGETVAEGFLDMLPDPNEYPMCMIDLIAYDMADEGDSYQLELIETSKIRKYDVN